MVSRLVKVAVSAVTVVMADGETVTIENENFAVVLPKAGFLYIEKPEEPEPRFLNLFLLREVRSRGIAPEFND